MSKKLIINKEVWTEVEVEVDLSEFSTEELEDELSDRDDYYDVDGLKYEAEKAVQAYRCRTPGWEEMMLEIVHEVAGKLRV
jgi:hypothetical protein